MGKSIDISLPFPSLPHISQFLSSSLCSLLKEEEEKVQIKVVEVFLKKNTHFKIRQKRPQVTVWLTDITPDYDHDKVVWFIICVKKRKQQPHK